MIGPFYLLTGLGVLFLSIGIARGAFIGMSGEGGGLPEQTSRLWRGVLLSVFLVGGLMLLIGLAGSYL